jgi:hypothetical protein
LPPPSAQHNRPGGPPPPHTTSFYPSILSDVKLLFVGATSEGTVTWVEGLSAYVTFLTHGLDIQMRTAPQLYGPWSAPQSMCVALVTSHYYVGSHVVYEG